MSVSVIFICTSSIAASISTPQDLQRIWLQPDQVVTSQKIIELIPLFEIAEQMDLLEKTAKRYGVDNYTDLDGLIKNCDGRINKGNVAQLNLSPPAIIMVQADYGHQKINWGEQVENEEKLSYKKFEESPSPGVFIKTIFPQPTICLPSGHSVLLSFLYLVHEMSHYALDDHFFDLNFKNYATLDSAIKAYHTQSGGEQRAYKQESIALQKIKKHFGLNMNNAISVFFTSSGDLISAKGLDQWVLNEYSDNGIYAKNLYVFIQLRAIRLKHISGLLETFIAKTTVKIFSSKQNKEREYYLRRLSDLTNFKKGLDSEIDDYNQQLENYY